VSAGEDGADRALALALLGSLALHASVAVWSWRAPRRPSTASRAPSSLLRTPSTGDTFEIDALLEAADAPRPAVPALVPAAPAAAPAVPARRPVTPPAPAAAPAARDVLAASPPVAASARTAESAGGSPATAPSGAASASATGSPPPTSAFAYGAEGSGDDPRDLEAALLRALPAAAASRVAGWEALAERTDLAARVTLELGDDGRLAALRVEPGAPDPLRVLLERCRWLPRAVASRSRRARRARVPSATTSPRASTGARRTRVRSRIQATSCAAASLARTTRPPRAPTSAMPPGCTSCSP
jgi:hypothetical protein